MLQRLGWQAGRRAAGLGLGHGAEPWARAGAVGGRRRTTDAAAGALAFASPRSSFRVPAASTPRRGWQPTPSYYSPSARSRQARPGLLKPRPFRVVPKRRAQLRLAAGQLPAKLLPYGRALSARLLLQWREAARAVPECCSQAAFHLMLASCSSDHSPHIQPRRPLTPAFPYFGPVTLLARPLRSTLVFDS